MEQPGYRNNRLYLLANALTKRGEMIIFDYLHGARMRMTLIFRENITDSHNNH